MYFSYLVSLIVVVVCCDAESTLMTLCVLRVSIISSASLKYVSEAVLRNTSLYIIHYSAAASHVGELTALWKSVNKKLTMVAVMEEDLVLLY